MKKNMKKKFVRLSSLASLQSGHLEEKSVTLTLSFHFLLSTGLVWELESLLGPMLDATCSLSTER